LMVVPSVSTKPRNVQEAAQATAAAVATTLKAEVAAVARAATEEEVASNGVSASLSKLSSSAVL